MHASGEHISLETEIPVEGEHISPTVYTEEHISAGRGQGYVCGETHIRATALCRHERHKTAVQFSVAPICRYERHKTACAVQ